MGTKKHALRLIKETIMIIESDPLLHIDREELKEVESVDRFIEMLEERNDLKTVLYGLNNLKRYL